MLSLIKIKYIFFSLYVYVCVFFFCFVFVPFHKIIKCVDKFSGRTSNAFSKYFVIFFVSLASENGFPKEK
jgi:hypothetical protein